MYLAKIVDEATFVGIENDTLTVLVRTVEEASMAPSAFPPYIQHVIDAAQQHQATQNAGGFIIVKWQERYTSYAPSMPYAPLEMIVGASTMALICCRFLLTAAGWEEISAEPSLCL